MMHSPILLCECKETHDAALRFLDTFIYSTVHVKDYEKEYSIICVGYNGDRWSAFIDVGVSSSYVKLLNGGISDINAWKLKMLKWRKINGCD